MDTWQISENYHWKTLRKEFTWIKRMEGVPQDPVFHAEGDVATHTSMVLEALQALPAFRQLSSQQQHILLAAALLHDVEKQSTTVIEEDGRITSVGHAKRGEFTARRILYQDIPAPFGIREEICKLVRHHGLPLWIFDMPDPAKAAIKASLDCHTKLLATLARADVLGRICPDQSDLLYKVDLFEELCKDNNCWGQPKSFPDNYTKFLYFHKEDVSPDYPIFNESRFEVILLSGLPGSGKDHYIHQYLPDMPVISPDGIRKRLKIAPTDKSGIGVVMQEAKERAKQYMRKHHSFIWNAPNISSQMRQQLIGLFTSYGGTVRIIYTEVPYELLQQHNMERGEEMPAEVVEKMIRKLDVPVHSEAHRVEYVVT